MLTQAIQRRIRELCDERNITVNKLATIRGITQSTINNILSGRTTKPTVSTIKKICDGLDITLSEFFDTDYFDSLEQEVK